MFNQGVGPTLLCCLSLEHSIGRTELGRRRAGRLGARSPSLSPLGLRAFPLGSRGELFKGSQQYIASNFGRRHPVLVTKTLALWQMFRKQQMQPSNGKASESCSVREVRVKHVDVEEGVPRP